MTSRRIERPATSEYNPRFDHEIGLVPDTDDFATLLRTQLTETTSFVAREFGEDHASVRYGPDKWTVREVIGHMSDVERILCYRALCVARGDMTVLPGFDETAYVPAADFEQRSMQSVIDELVAVRGATAALVETLSNETAARQGNVSSGTMTVRALLYLIAGHELHHRTLLRERYLPCIATAASR